MTDTQADRIAAALERIEGHLAQIAGAFDSSTPIPAPAAPCAHPIECRVDESVMGHPDRFLCDQRLGGCGRRNYDE